MMSNNKVNNKQRILTKLYCLSRGVKRCLMLSTDTLLLPIALWSAMVLRRGTFTPPIGSAWWLFWVAPAVAIPIFIRLGFYRQIVRYIESKFLFTVFKGVTLSVLALLVIEIATWQSPINTASWAIFWLLAALYIISSRVLIRSLFQNINKTGPHRTRVVIYGAGQAGVDLVNAFRFQKNIFPVAFLDDNPELSGNTICGLRVYKPSELARLIEREHVDEVLLAMPSASFARRREIISSIEVLPVHVKTVPGLNDLLTGRIQVDNVRELDIEDLLGRDPVPPIDYLMDACIRNKSVMVTGAGGSIGSELCRQILKLGPKCLVLFERSEFALYQIHQELLGEKKMLGHTAEVIPILGSVTNLQRVETTLRSFKVQSIYHAAAYKHVPLVEYNIIEGVRNNVLGTLRCAEAAVIAKVETFVLISTDKAVRPTNIMGATKRFAELILQGMARQQSQTRFTMVRFGNVLGSSGSVVPLFRKQIKQGGPVTITHPEITRYFMTIPEASQLVLQAGAMGKGGDVFVLDMGQPVKIINLARQMVRLCGLSMKDQDNPNGDIEIVATGLRPGEKLYEELLIGDNVEITQHPRIMRANEVELPWRKIIEVLDNMIDACEKSNVARVRSLLMEYVDGYRPQCDIEDFVWNASKHEEVTDGLSIG